MVLDCFPPLHIPICLPSQRDKSVVGNEIGSEGRVAAHGQGQRIVRAAGGTGPTSEDVARIRCGGDGGHAAAKEVASAGDSAARG